MQHFNLSPDEFWAMSYNEFLSIYLAYNPSLNSTDEPFFTEEELAMLEKMKGF